MVHACLKPMLRAFGFEFEAAAMFQHRHGLAFGVHSIGAPPNLRYKFAIVASRSS